MLIATEVGNEVGCERFRKRCGVVEGLYEVLTLEGLAEKGTTDGRPDDISEGAALKTTGAAVGAWEGSDDGNPLVGSTVGASVGMPDGRPDGINEGAALETRNEVGCMDGSLDGSPDGITGDNDTGDERPMTTDGRGDGSDDGRPFGINVGANVGSPVGKADGNLKK